MTRLSVATASVPGDLLTKLERIAAAGFTGVELHEPDLTGFAGTVRDVATKAASLGLTIEILQPFHDFEGLNGSERKAALARLDRKLELMAELGAGSLLVESSTRSDSSSDPEAIVTDLAELAARAGRVGCRAALIALPWAAHVSTELQALEIVELVDSPHLGLALNSFFSLSCGSQAARLRDIPGDRIFHVQLSDAPALEFDASRLKNHFGLLPGQGELDLPSFVRIVARKGYVGQWSVARIRGSAEDNRETYARDGFRALVSLLDEVSRDEPSLPRPFPELPPRVYPTGVEFIEFAVNEDSGGTLTEVLRSMSFRKERKHVSKSVELWRQGAVNIVVNSETEGFAAEACPLPISAV